MTKQAPPFRVDKLQLRGFELVSSEFWSEPFASIKPGVDHGSFDLEQSFGTADENRVLFTFLKVRGRVTGPDGERVVARYEVVYRFIFVYGSDPMDVADLFFVEPGEPEMLREEPHKVMLSISYATTRGLLAGFLANTCFAGLHLPVRTVDQLAEVEVFGVSK